MSCAVVCVRQFCTEFQLPDVSPLIDENLPLCERYSVVWRVMQHSLKSSLQVGFLRKWCECITSDRVEMLSSFLDLTMDENKRDNFFRLLMMEDGMEQAFDQAVVAYCQIVPINGIITFTQKHGLQSIVSGIKAAFPVDERMQTALDNIDFVVLKALDEAEYDANPDEFMRKHAADMDAQRLEDEETIFNSKMRLLAEEINRLKLRKANLELQLAGSPGTPPASPRTHKRARGSRSATST
jgi:hypothetical protein